MENKSETKTKDKSIVVKLNSITHHYQYDHFCELLATTNYVLTSGYLFSKRALEVNLRIHPIIVVEVKNQTDRYSCVGGYRSLNIAKSSMPLDEDIPVILIPRPSNEEISLMVNADVLLTHLLFSVCSPDSIGSIFINIQKDMLSMLVEPEIRTKKAFAKQLGYSYNTLFQKTIT